MFFLVCVYIVVTWDYSLDTVCSSQQVKKKYILLHLLN